MTVALSKTRDPQGWRPSEFRAFLALTWPLVLTNAIEMAMNLTNVAMVGRIGPDALAAATLGMALNSLFLLFGIGVVAAVAPLISKERGRSAMPDLAIRRIVQQSLWGVVIIAGPMFLILWNGRAIFRLLGQDPGLSAAAGHYLHALQWSILPLLVYLVLRSLLATLDRPRWAVLTGIAAVALNALLNWLLISGHAGLPILGLVGSGVATLLSNIFMAAALALVAVLDPHLRRLRLFSGLLRPDWTGFGDFWRLGLPIGISLLLETGMFAAAAALVGQFDVASLAAHAIALQVASLTFMVPLGIAQAATIRIGRASGAGNRPAIAREGHTALGLGIGTMAVFAIVLLTMPRPIIHLFIDLNEPGAAAVERLGIVLLAIAGLFQIADGAQAVLSGMLRGLQDTRTPMLIAAFGYWGIGLPLGALLAFGLHFQAAGVWIGLTAGLFTVAVLLFGRWRAQLRRAALERPSGFGVAST